MANTQDNQGEDKPMPAGKQGKCILAISLGGHSAAWYASLLVRDEVVQLERVALCTRRYGKSAALKRAHDQYQGPKVWFTPDTPD